MHAPKHRKKRELERLTILILCLALTASLTGGAMLMENMRARSEQARRALAAQLMPEIQKCVRIARKMAYAGADIRGQLLPELKIILPAVVHLNLAVREICGAEYMPVDETLLYKLNEAVSLLENAYLRSASAASAEAALRQKLGALEVILASRFTDAGDLVKSERYS